MRLMYLYISKIKLFFNIKFYSNIAYEVIEQQNQIESLCSTIDCDYPGAYCSVDDGKPKCICDTISCISDHEKVCGEDGQTYASRCDLMKFSCTKQIRIGVAHIGQCSPGKIV